MFSGPAAARDTAQAMHRPQRVVTSDGEQDTSPRRTMTCADAGQKAVRFAARSLIGSARPRAVT